MGLSLVSMEAINDFGTVDYFTVKSLSAGIYDAWLNMGNVGAAAQIASLTMVFVVLLITLERMARARTRQYTSPDRFGTIERYRLTPTRGWLATLACALPVLLGFVVPFVNLIRMSLAHLDQFADEDFLGYATHSFTLAASAALLTTAIAVVIAYSKRLHAGKRSLQLAARLSFLGYALPGAVLAIGVIIPLGRVR